MAQQRDADQGEDQGEEPCRRRIFYGKDHAAKADAAQDRTAAEQDPTKKTHSYSQSGFPLQGVDQTRSRTNSTMISANADYNIILKQGLDLPMMEKD